MKVLFLNPSRAGQGNIPLNIPILISILKHHKHEVSLFDFSDYAVLDKTSEVADIYFKKAEYAPEEIICDRKKFYGDKYGINISGCDLKKTGLSIDFEKLMLDFKPDIIAVSSLSVDFYYACDFLLPFKEKFGVPVVFGGIHAILLPDETLNYRVCDFVCVGEGEKTLIELLDAIENKKPLESVRGIWFKRDGNIIKNQPMELTDLAELVVPDYDCFDPIHFYRPLAGKRYKMLNYELSRGCLFNCSYCVNGVLKQRYRGLGRYHRVKPVEKSIRELKSLIKKYNFNFIRFWDEDFTSLKEDYIEKFAESYLKEIGLPFLIYARVETVTERKVQILKEMGCRTVAMGIESGNEFIRKTVMNRKMSNKTIVEKFALVKKYGIRVSSYNIIGVPFDTRETIFDTIELNRKVTPDSFSATMLEPYKGTPIRKICEEQGLDPGYETSFNNKPQFIPKGMTYDELNGLFLTFPFYVRFPKERYEEIRLAESDRVVYQKLKEEFLKCK